jgi:general secretion pathway protein F
MRFRIHAADARGQVTSLSLEAQSEAAALEILRGRGLQAFHVSSTGVKLRWKASGAFPTALFSAELMALLDAGLNLVEALQALAEKDAGGVRHEVLASILGAIRRGEPLSQAVAALPRHFPPLYVATIKASERTGNVREALGRYIAYQEELDRVKKKVVSASIYPAILALVGSLVLAFLLFYVVPRFAHVYEDMAGGLPLFSRLLLSFGAFVGDNAWLIAFGFASLVVAAAWLLSKQSVRGKLNTALWRIPALGERMKVYQLARLYRTMGMLLDAGIPAARALAMTRDLLAAHLRPQLDASGKQIQQGLRMSAALAAAGLATPVASRMMAVGERGGEMGRMLAEIARFHDDEVARFIDIFTRAFEPILMTVLGVAVGGVVVLMYMPIFELAGSIR